MGCLLRKIGILRRMPSATPHSAVQSLSFPIRLNSQLQSTLPCGAAHQNNLMVNQGASGQFESISNKRVQLRLKQKWLITSSIPLYKKFLSCPICRKSSTKQNDIVSYRLLVDPFFSNVTGFLEICILSSEVRNISNDVNTGAIKHPP